MTDTLAFFQSQRRRLFAIAYRMLGVRADAEDVLQDAYLRWQNADVTQLDSPEAWLVTVTTRLSIDRLRAMKAEREAYIGTWLPEPMIEMETAESPEELVERADNVAYALLVVLERLGPEERAAFLLKQVFDQDYPEIAHILGKSEASCRQLVHRAKTRVQRDQPRFSVTPQTHRQQLQRFIEAAQSGDYHKILALLSPDVQSASDGGGKVPATFRPLYGADRVARLYYAVARRIGAHISYRFAHINGELGLLRYYDGQLESALSIVTDESGIAAIYTMRNPDKLKHFAAMQDDAA
ncbi:MAG TPA: RNA polymerase sigma-70 factor [Oxalicibacterium sp.]|jgi:RNA polymerase sigma-70 factor (ECF subfamily)|nr:RNA polymerase sigma-70 factor [Oxalicibacterium sp.]